MTKLVIIANSAMPNLDLCHKLIQNSDLVIACDGGFTHCITNGFKCDILIGDLDSISKQQLATAAQQNIEIIKLDNQHNNDLSKALHYAKELNPSKIDIIGVDGGDYAHQMANYLALLEHDVDASLQLTDCVVKSVTHLNPLHYSIDSKSGFSVFSIGISKGVNISGAKWELSDQQITPSSLGLHNESRGNLLKISCQSGALIVFIDR